MIYERGIGIEQNQTQAAQWYEESARQGYVDAQYNIGIMYASGRGVAADDGKAMMWLALAAKQKDKESRKLLMKFIDGELDEHTQSTPAKIDKVESDSIVSITPVTLITKGGAVICDEKNRCEPYKVGSVITSTSKRVKWYKVSGIATKKGWQAYEKEGWIDENSVEIRR